MRSDVGCRVGLECRVDGVEGGDPLVVQERCPGVPGVGVEVGMGK